MVDVIARAVRAARRDRARDLTPERLLTLLWSSPERLAAAAPDLSATERDALQRPPGESLDPGRRGPARRGGRAAG